MQAKALLRQITTEQEQSDWDVPLPEEKEMQWKLWKDSLLELEQLNIPRPYVSVSLSATKRREICIFSDASTMAIASVAYLRVIDTEGQSHVGFLMGKSKLAPRPAHTVPRLELCAAVLAVEMADMITTELDIEIHAINFYTDSKIVLGYIHNASRRFYTYVANRVTRIRKSTSPEQWHHISTDKNPADHGTRLVPAAALKQTNWFVGPSFLRKPETKETTQVEAFQLIEPDQDKEVRSQVAVCRTLVTRDSLGAHRFERFSSWKSLTRAIGKLICLARSSCRATNTDQHSNDHLEQAKVTIIRCVQQEVFKEEIQGLLKKEEISQHNSLKDLYTKQWKQVQSLADIFWKRWRQEYLVIFQPRKKWQDDKPNIQVGDFVLLKDSQAHRNEWPIGLIVGTDPSSDARVRKVEVRIVRQGIPKVYARPISEVFLLLSKG
ncbi:uncharacterized protein LOC130296773 [Hyla sarda]|uniref:uncharacterized protein LOC130296773 n=1 Tax=Hyla sarda TaxID=327740 RepID=UPI0024C2C88E|nr:uncharacterized protein LOC130296773 [Hyla sarda]